MGYYMGDFYRGARGDPGFFSFLKKAALQVGTMGASAIPFVGPAASKILSKIPAPARAAGSAVIAKMGAHPVLTAAGGAGVVAAAAGAEMMHARGSVAAAGMAGGGGHMRGRCRHINPRTGKCIRRMNSCNPRALRRAIRRTHAFAKLAMKTIHLVHPKKHARFGGFKKRRKK